MNHESSTIVALDEIDRLFVVCDKAKEYLKRITSGIDQQVSVWQQRRDIVFNSRGSSSSVDFLIPKTQRINELTIEAVQALCKVDVIVEQILRIDLQSAASTRSTATVPSFSTRSVETKVPQTTAIASLARTQLPAPSPGPTPLKPQPNVERTLNGKSTSQSPFPIPVLRTLQQTGAGHGSPASTQEKAGFKPIEQQQQKSSLLTDTNTTRPTPIHPQDSHYSATESAGLSRGFDFRPSPSGRMSSLSTAASNSQVLSSYQRPTQEKVKVKLQRIPPGTKWKRARIETIDSLSAFYVENHDERVHARFCEMLNDLHDHYDNLEKSNRLAPLHNVAIGDFGVAKFEGDNRWYRARLLACEEDNQLRIVYIDFGNIEVKSMNDFFPLEQTFAQLPAQAIACSLSDAFPKSDNENDPLWPPETIRIFQEEVKDKDVEVTFVAPDEDTIQWPLHFVKINVGNQSVNSSMNLKQCIDPRPNRFIAEKLMPSLTHQEYILFNVPINDEEAE